MCFVCDACGYKSVDVKPGGETCDKGVEFTLKIGHNEGDGRDRQVDLSRDVIKSADAMVPEIYPCDPAAEPYTRCSAEEITFIEKITAAIGAEPAEASSQAPPSPQLDFPRPCP